MGESVLCKMDRDSLRKVPQSHPSFMEGTWLGIRHSAEFAARHFGKFFLRQEPAITSEVGVHFSAFFAALNLAVIDTVMGHVNVHIDSSNKLLRVAVPSQWRTDTCG